MFNDMTPDKITINNIDFKWGTTFEESRILLPFEDIKTWKSFWEGFEFRCLNFAGFDTTTCTIRGPKSSRPVMQVSFGLKPLPKKWFENHHSPYTSKLNKLFGKPHQISKSKPPNGLNYNESYASGSVIYNCKWWFGDILVSLSVFGGIRESSEGGSAAGLYLDWMNEKDAADPYMEKFYEREVTMCSDITDIFKLTSELEQRPYHRSHYELKSPHNSLKDDVLRACQMALYTDELYRVPLLISKQTEAKDLGIFFSKENNTYCVYNKWDFSPVTEHSTLMFTNIFPARGSGGKELKINSLVLKDEISSNVLDNLKSELEKLTTLKFRYIETYDD